MCRLTKYRVQGLHFFRNIALTARTEFSVKGKCSYLFQCNKQISPPIFKHCKKEMIDNGV